MSVLDVAEVEQRDEDGGERVEGGEVDADDFERALGRVEVLELVLVDLQQPQRSAPTRRRNGTYLQALARLVRVQVVVVFHAEEIPLGRRGEQCRLLRDYLHELIEDVVVPGRGGERRGGAAQGAACLSPVAWNVRRDFSSRYVLSCAPLIVPDSSNSTTMNLPNRLRTCREHNAERGAEERTSSCRYAASWRYQTTPESALIRAPRQTVSSGAWAAQVARRPSARCPAGRP